MARQYDKLVRDRIPDVVRENGEEPTVRTVDGDEYSERLVEKLDEEVAEYRETRDVEELADVLEVVHAIREDSGVTVDELAAMRAAKVEERGRFADGVVLERVEE